MEEESVMKDKTSELRSGEEMAALVRQTDEDLLAGKCEKELPVQPDASECPHILEDFYSWRHHPMTGRRVRGWCVLVLLVTGFAVLCLQRIPVRWLLPDPAQIVRAEITRIMPSAGADPRDTAVADDPARVLEILEPLYCWPYKISYSPSVSARHTYRIVFYTADKDKTVFVWRGGRIDITNAAGITLRMRSAYPYMTDASYNLYAIQNSKMEALWREYGMLEEK